MQIIVPLRTYDEDYSVPSHFVLKKKKKWDEEMLIAYLKHILCVKIIGVEDVKFYISPRSTYEWEMVDLKCGCEGTHHECSLAPNAIEYKKDMVIPGDRTFTTPRFSFQLRGACEVFSYGKYLNNHVYSTFEYSCPYWATKVPVLFFPLIILYFKVKEKIWQN